MSDDASHVTFHTGKNTKPTVDTNKVSDHLINKKSNNYKDNIFILVSSVIFFIIWTFVTFRCLEATKKYSIIMMIPLSILSGIFGTIFILISIAAGPYGTF